MTKVTIEAQDSCATAFAVHTSRKLAQGICALLLAATLSLTGFTGAHSQSLILTSETVRSLPDNNGAIGILYTDEALSNGQSAIYVATVDEVLGDSLASQLSPGDMILKVDDKEAASVSLIGRYVRSLRPGATVQLTVLRAGTRKHENVVVPIVNRSGVAIPGISAPPSSTEAFARSCAGGAIAGILTAGLTLLISPLDGGFSFAVFAPKAAAGALIGCAAVGAGTAVAQEIVPSGSVIAYRRVL